MSKFKVLIVEDSESKLKSIQSVVERILPEVSLRKAFSVRSAIDALEDEIPDFIIADMSLPTYDIEVRERGGTPRPFGGIEVFETLERYEIQIPVLVVTSYPVLSEGSKSLGLTDLSKKLKNDFPDNFLDTVYFDSAFSDWERGIELNLKLVVEKKHAS
ncbi:response regulator [Pseudomonas aeruginosa]|uniref:response regulator n=1 Tax=Pseudomonas aeruginosa TaxID=287 RepID=UPI0008FB288D|nr:response regulator [Pseudomonas aeruginosa]EKB9382315.1 response regulator [Pseudomonas aeruginosa]EKV2963728.1 response regulator [Pseudomonas aeruginosa]EKV3144020.1 response regulator [Pseudomonas aeruginosa]EKY0800214.1 response regulator [Pseudomonas aeruginosa]ELD4448447.1 response regulator [Pseudomonas aeruginosa]